MTTLDDHLSYVLEHPNERTAARALIDRAEEVFSVPHVDAVKWVAKQRREERNARELAAARMCIMPGTKWAPLVRLHIRNAAGPEQALSATIIIVPGSRRPQFIPANPHETNAAGLSHVLRVGARWVIDRAKMLTEDMEDDDESERAMHQLDRRV